MRAFEAVVTLLQLSHASAAAVDYASRARDASATAFYPSGIAVGKSYSSKTSHREVITLNSTFPFATVDYGNERAGWPFFEVVEVSGSVQLETRYSEAFMYLDLPFADGPYPFNVAQANTFRVETFNITEPGTVKAFLLQGGQRWQSFQLLTNGTITLRNIGFEPSITTVETSKLPGSFSSSNETLNEIWALGAQGAITSCVDKGSQGAVWQVDSKQGVYIANQRPAQTLQGANFANYTLEFDTFIDRGGAWWSVANPFGRFGGLHLQLVGELPEESTFVNTNKTVTPPNTVQLASGYAFVNQTTLTSYYLDTFEVPFVVKEKTWYHIKTVLDPKGYLSVSVNNTLVFNATLSNYYVGGSAISLSGSFGFGAWQDHAAYFRNAAVYDTVNGSTLYTSDLTNQDVLAEYGTQESLASVCLDGPKRDRLVWLGDFYHTSRIIGSSTGRFDHTRGTLDFLLETQLSNGQLSISPNLAYDPTDTNAFAPDGTYGLDDYQGLGFLSFYHYMRQSNDIAYANKTWSQWGKQLDWLVDKINATDGLIHFTSAFLGDAAAGSAVSCLSVETLNGAADIAEAIGKTTSASNFRKLATALATKINDQLWSDKLGTYVVSVTSSDAFSVASTAFCLTSGVASKNQTVSAVSALDDLQLGVGYKDSSALESNDSDTHISPNTNGFLLPAILAAEDWDRASNLIFSEWGAMVSNIETSSGASWEYLTPDGLPGLEAFTSLGHPWGGAATYILTEWVAGLRAADGLDGFGYKNWIVNPALGVHMGLQEASATIPLYPSGELYVKWKMSKGKLAVQVLAPSSTKGVFKLGKTTKTLQGKKSYSFTVQV